ncbi:MAG: sigma factor-like helix-turn-helix DNA-binding protein, partial [Clostridium sp.]
LDTIEIKDKNTLEEEILISENRSEVINLLNELEPLDRDIFIMKFFLGLKAEDIGVKVGLSKSAVDSRIYRNKKVLKKSAISLKLGVV